MNVNELLSMDLWKVENILEELAAKVKSLEEALDISILKWQYVSEMEKKFINGEISYGDWDEVIEYIACTGSTCGLCRYFVFCDNCPLHDESMICCWEFTYFSTTSQGAEKVLNRLLKIKKELIDHGNLHRS